MTDNEIIKALECCKNGKCITQNCPYSHYPYEGDECHPALAKDALDLINRQKAENKEKDEIIKAQADRIFLYEEVLKSKTQEIEILDTVLNDKEES